MSFELKTRWYVIALITLMTLDLRLQGLPVGQLALYVITSYCIYLFGQYSVVVEKLNED